MKKLLAWILITAICLCFNGCGDSLDQFREDMSVIGQVMADAMDGVNNPDQEKVFTNSGVTLTLNTSFMDFTETTKNSEGYPFLYANDAIGIIAIEENKQELFSQFGETDLQGYAELIIELYSLDATVEKKDGFWTYAYEAAADTDSHTFLCVFFETENAFWNLQSYCQTDLYPQHQQEMWKYLTSATFTDG